jgi:ABC-type lipoprotein export system ATPase subunit
LSQNITSGTELDLQEQILIDKKNELSASNLQLEKQLSDIELLIKNLFSAEIPNEEQLMRRLNILREIESNFKQLEIYLNFPSDTFLIDIVEKTMLVSSSFETYNKASLEAKQHNQVIDLTKNEIEKILAEIEILQPKLRRAQFANEQLNTLLKEQSKGSFLKEYIVKNKTEIVSIFKLIHTPTEFHDIDFAGQKITLITNESTKRTLSEISTGQRSALALSIFLSLNKKLTKGPNILIFDDPVVYVDDMNVLSFFDYLRELVIKSKRQVFFATANDDLAFLFRKKFEFLETEFKEYRLERESDNVKFQ